VADSSVCCLHTLCLQPVVPAEDSACNSWALMASDRDACVSTNQPQGLHTAHVWLQFAGQRCRRLLCPVAYLHAWAWFAATAHAIKACRRPWHVGWMCCMWLACLPGRRCVWHFGVWCAVLWVNWVCIHNAHCATCTAAYSSATAGVAQQAVMCHCAVLLACQWSFRSSGGGCAVTGHQLTWNLQVRPRRCACVRLQTVVVF
jgi:hypothetical protein